MNRPYVIDPHYILSSRTSLSGSTLRLWAPEALGYVDTLEDAGCFAGDQIRGWPSRYNDGTGAIAVPCALVEATAWLRKGVRKGHVVPRSKLAWLKAAAARVASFQAPAHRDSAPAGDDAPPGLGRSAHHEHIEMHTDDAEGAR